MNAGDKMSKKKLDFKTFKEEVLKDAAFKMEYEALRPEFELIMQCIKARKIEIEWFPQRIEY